MVWASAHLSEAGAFRQALPFAERALSILEMAMPDEIASLNVCLGVLGFIHKQLGDSTKAVTAHLKRIDILRRAPSLDLESLAGAYSDLASQYEFDGKHDLCVAALKDAEQFTKQLSPPNDQLANRIASCRGVVAINQERYDEAIASLEISLQCEQRNPTSNPWISMNNLAYALIKANKRLEQAEDLLLKAKPLIPDEISRRYFLNTLGALAQANGEFDWAEAIYRASLDCSTTSRAKATELTSLGDLYHELGRHTEAIQAYQQAMQNAEQALPADHPQRLTILRKLAACTD